ncbi:MAG: hypothetical protein ACI837_003385 [Crocinitomicaceae bacterium]|jgi:hypothetical protein
MKKVYAMAVGLLFTGAVNAQDLIVSSISFNYDFLSAIVSNVSFDIENIGTFTTFDAVTCEVYAVDIGSNEYLIGSVDSDGFGVSAGNTETLSVGDVDLDNIAGMTTGTYYLRVDVDVNDVETEDNESNNSLTDTGNPFDFEALTTGLEANNSLPISISVFPNPVTESSFSIKLSNLTTNNAVELKIFDINGNMVKSNSLAAYDGEMSVDASGLQSGIYFYNLTVDGTLYRGKIIRK